MPRWQPNTVPSMMIRPPIVYVRAHTGTPSPASHFVDMQLMNDLMIGHMSFLYDWKRAAFQRSVHRCCTIESIQGSEFCVECFMIALCGPARPLCPLESKPPSPVKDPPTCMHVFSRGVCPFQVMGV